MSKVAKRPLFADLAVRSYDSTFRAIFNQAHEEIDRLGRINVAMRLLEDNLLNPDRIQDMDTMQQIALLELLSRNQQTSIRNVSGFGTMLTKVRNLVSIHDGIKRVTQLESEEDDGESPIVTGRLLELHEDLESVGVYALDDDDEVE